MLRLIFISVFIGLLAPSYGRTEPQLLKDPSFRPVLEKAIAFAYNFQPDSAEKTLHPWKTKFPKNPLWSFWRGFETWWLITADMPDTRRDNAFFYHFSKADYQCTQVLEENPTHLDALVIKSTANAFMARLAANRHNWIKSLDYAQIAYEALVWTKKEDPTNTDLLFSDGLMTYYAAAIPEKYPVVGPGISWFIGEGNKKQGLEMLELASVQGLFMRYEAVYFLGNILLNYEQNPSEAVTHAENLVDRFPGNPFFARMNLRILYKTGDLKRLETALSVFEHSFSNRNPSPALKEEMLFHTAILHSISKSSTEAVAAFEKQLAFSEKLAGGKTRHLWMSGALELAKLYHKNARLNEGKKLLYTVIDVDQEGPWLEEAEQILREWTP